MALEKRWAEVSPQSFVVDGTADGVVQIPDTRYFHVKQLVILKSGTQPARKFQVNRVISKTILLLGNLKEALYLRADVSDYTLADGATIEAEEQPRPSIGKEDYQRAVFEEEPAVANRSILVDQQGNTIGSTSDNPLQVELSDGSINIGTVNAELEVQLSHLDNDPDAGDVHDSIRVGDGVDQLEVNPDGSINVNLVASSVSISQIKSFYGEVSAVPSSTPTTITTYTVPAATTAFLQKAFVSGENIAKYQVKLNGSALDTARTYFSGPLNETFDFSDATKGLPLTVGDTVTVEVEHGRPAVGDFNGRIQVVEV